MRPCPYGGVEIDNNAAERALRCAAAFYSLIGTTKLNGHNPEAFLREVLTRISEHPVSGIAELLPVEIISPRAAPIAHCVGGI